MHRPPDELSLAALTEYSIQEMGKYRRREPSNDRYCLEILRRATHERNDEAWAVWQHLFNDHVHIWLARHPNKELALRYDMEQNYVDDAFRRFWQAVKDQRLTFHSLAGALSYLHLCLHGSIMDTLRAYARPREEPLPDYGHSGSIEPAVEDHYQEDELWRVIENLLPGPKERRVAYLHFHCNLKPREIVRYCPDEFNNEEEIYRLKRNIMERLLRNAEKLRWRLGDR